MKFIKIFCILFPVVLCITPYGHGSSEKKTGKKKILVISSYHKEYLWSQESNKGFCEAMLKYGYFDSQDQATKYTRNNFVETSKVIIKKVWMDAKRKSSKSEKEDMSIRIYKIARDFKPDLIFLGDDDAAEYIGKQYLDTKVPIIFWGVNSTPVKHGLVDSAERPGHNVTGVYQSGYYVESLRLLKVIAPTVKTFAVLTDATVTGRTHYKEIEYLDRQGGLPLKLVEIVSTDDFEIWKAKALALQKKVDAFMVAHYAGLKDPTGAYVSPDKVAEWYSAHITIPEAVEQHQFVEQGMLCGADDSGYKQAYEAVSIAHDIWTKGADPATYPTRTPKRRALMVNVKRAKALGINLTPEMGIEEFIGGDVR